MKRTHLKQSLLALGALTSAACISSGQAQSSDALLNKLVDKGILNDSRTSYLIFESNYRGSWDSYLDDFVYKTLIPMNLLWGNLEGFPSKGCQDIEMFKQHQRPRQFPAQVYYCAYPELTVQNILCDRNLAKAIRDLKDYLSGAYSLLSTAQDPLLMRLIKLMGE